MAELTYLESLANSVVSEATAFLTSILEGIAATATDGVASPTSTPASTGAVTSPTPTAAATVTDAVTSLRTSVVSSSEALQGASGTLETAASAISTSLNKVANTGALTAVPTTTTTTTSDSSVHHGGSGSSDLGIILGAVFGALALLLLLGLLAWWLLRRRHRGRLGGRSHQLRSSTHSSRQFGQSQDGASTDPNSSALLLEPGPHRYPETQEAVHPDGPSPVWLSNFNRRASRHTPPMTMHPAFAGLQTNRAGTAEERNPFFSPNDERLRHGKEMDVSVAELAPGGNTPPSTSDGRGPRPQTPLLPAAMQSRSERRRRDLNPFVSHDSSDDDDEDNLVSPILPPQRSRYRAPSNSVHYPTHGEAARFRFDQTQPRELQDTQVKGNAAEARQRRSEGLQVYEGT